jgi:hypothetical protein
MRKMVMALAATAALGSFGLNAPASAAEAKTAPVNEIVSALQTGDVQSDYVQYRRYYGGRGYYGGGPRYVERRYYGPRRYGYYPRGYYRRDYGGAAAAGALGLATGAIIGGALAQQQAQPTYVAPNGGSSYCAQRYKSYDPASGTYLGYDGARHPCP